MINNLYNIGLTSLQNSQASINNASNNVANADTPGYQRTTVNYETGDSITANGLTVGTGADIASIESAFDSFVEAQYLDASADLAEQNAAYGYASQLDSLLNQTDGGLNQSLGEFTDAWNELVTDPESLAGREALLGEAETLVYGITSTSEQLKTMQTTIDNDIRDEVDEANRLIEDIAAYNVAVTANPDDLQAVSDRDQLIRELNDVIGVDALYKENGSVTLLTDDGHLLVDGAQTHTLVFEDARAVESQLRDSEYDGEIAFAGDSSEEILLEFVSGGPDGTAQFRASTDGGAAWLADESGDTQLFIAGDEDAPVEIAGVEIWFAGGTQDHMTGDRYAVMPKGGLYVQEGDGSLRNVTPLTDDAGEDVPGRTSGGSLAGLFAARDDIVVPTLDSLDDVAEALIWEVNAEHAQGAGLESHASLNGSYSVDDPAVALSNSGLPYADRIETGELRLATYDADGEVSTAAVISVDPAVDSLDDVAAAINTAMGGDMTVSVDADGRLVLSASPGMSFEVDEDTSNLTAALGINTFFTGSSADDLALDSLVATDTAHINAGRIDENGATASGANEVAAAIAGLSEATVTVGDRETTLSSGLAALVADVGSAARSTELKQAYALTSAQYLYDRQASISQVNIDEELVELTKHQQAYQAAAEIITVTRNMMDTVLDMV